MLMLKQDETRWSKVSCVYVGRLDFTDPEPTHSEQASSVPVRDEWRTMERMSRSWFVSSHQKAGTRCSRSLYLTQLAYLKWKRLHMYSQTYVHVHILRVGMNKSVYKLVKPMVSNSASSNTLRVLTAQSCAKVVLNRTRKEHLLE